MNIKSDGENLRKAVKWVLEEKKFNSEKPLQELINEACLKFDLSPMDAEFLHRSRSLKDKPD
ncbi:MAG: hypothetical protein ACE5DO_02650 [Desulfobacterales bacterium]